MGDFFYPIAAVVAWAAVGLKLRHLRTGPRTAPLITVCLSCGLLAVAFTTATSVDLAPRAWLRVDRFVGADISTLVEHLCVMLFSASVLVLLLQWAYPPEQARPRITRRLALVGVSLVGIVVLFGVARPAYAPTSDAAWNSDTPSYVAYLLLYLFVFTVTLVEIARLCRRYAHAGGRVWLRRGLLITAIGAVIGVGYTVTHMAQVIGAEAGANLTSLRVLARLCASLGAILVMVGLTIPSWGASLAQTLAYHRRRRVYKRLHPLWAALSTVAPRLTPDPPMTPQTGPGPRRRSDVDLLLARRVVEIRDGSLAVRAWRDPHAVEAARRQYEQRGLRGDDLAAAVEATWLAVALAAKANGEPPARAGETLPHAANAVWPGSAEATTESLDEEAAWLARVAVAFAHPPSLHPGRRPHNATPAHGAPEEGTAA